MQSTAALRIAMLDLLAADATTLAPAMDGNKVALVKAPFSPSENTVIGDLTLADFVGSTPLVCGTGTQPTGLDPFTNDNLCDIKSPAGGFRWETTDVTNLPQTIYGFALLSNDLSTLLACAVFTTPIVLTAVNQVVDGLSVQLRNPANTLV